MTGSTILKITSLFCTLF